MFNRAASKLRSVLAGMRGQLIMHLNAVKASIMRNLVDWFEMMAANLLLAVEVDRTGRRLLDLRASSADLVEHRQVVVLVGNA